MYYLNCKYPKQVTSIGQRIRYQHKLFDLMSTWPTVKNIKKKALRYALDAGKH